MFRILNSCLHHRGSGVSLLKDQGVLYSRFHPIIQFRPKTKKVCPRSAASTLPRPGRTNGYSDASIVKTRTFCGFYSGVGGILIDTEGVVAIFALPGPFVDMKKHRLAETYGAVMLMEFSKSHSDPLEYVKLDSQNMVEFTKERLAMKDLTLPEIRMVSDVSDSLKLQPVIQHCSKDDPKEGCYIGASDILSKFGREGRVISYTEIRKVGGLPVELQEVLNCDEYGRFRDFH